ncbi:hypothetical protein DH2020_040079 [Rehmannia glutinosa]|uniref:Uncharacterized protein n=1 Tax=Rehmannia glutinosa TaxID=99300 RepID=A0ABR0UV89_REHGL
MFGGWALILDLFVLFLLRTYSVTTPDISRSGRAGRSGEAITLYTEADVPFLRNVANVIAASGCEERLVAIVHLPRALLRVPDPDPLPEVMNLLARAKLSARIRLFTLHPITSLQQSNLYSTKTAPYSQKTQRLTNDRTQKPSEQSSSFSQRFKKQTGAKIDWPKPIEIPYQAKVANSVNLIGHIKTPVQFGAAPDGKDFAATVISQENSGENSSVLIPVVFEGDLAHVVACHVKENDCVFVSGQLSTEPMRFDLNGGLGKFHLVAENLNFVEGFVRKVSAKKQQVSFSGVEIEKPKSKKIEEVIKKVDDDEDFNRKWQNALENAKVKRFSGENDWASSSVTKPSENVAESKPGKGDDNANKKKNGDQSLDLWKDLVKSPLQWWDYRNHKSNGLVKEKFPDFKHKATGDSLWIDSAPGWVLAELGNLEFDVKFIKAKQMQGVGEGIGESKKVGKGEDSWKNLVENPNKWWDNRLDKRNPRAPDFKHKETGEGLWLSDTPDWALSRLPVLKDSKMNLQAF